MKNEGHIYLPAGAGERMQYFSLQFNDCTIRFVLHYPGLLDAACLLKATRAVIDGAEILHASFIPGNIKSQWQVHNDYEDSSCFQHIKTDDDPLDVALAYALQPVPEHEKTQFRCCLAQNGSSSAVSINISHLCVDGGDGRYLAAKLAEAYSRIKATGNCEGLHIKNGSRSAEQVYRNLSLPKFLALLKSPFSATKSIVPLPSQEAGEPRIVTRIISAQTMNAARQQAKQDSATTNDLLLAACYHAYAGIPGVDAAAPASIVSMMDLRRHCIGGDSPGLANMSGTMITLPPNGISQSFETTLAEIALQTAAAKGDPLSGLVGLPLLHTAVRRLPMKALLFAAQKVYKNMALGLTNPGNSQASQFSMDALLPDMLVFGGPCKMKPSVQISAISLENTCTLSIIGNYTEADAALFRSLLENMENSLLHYIKKAPSKGV